MAKVKYFVYYTHEDFGLEHGETPKFLKEALGYAIATIQNNVLLFIDNQVSEELNCCFCLKTSMGHITFFIYPILDESIIKKTETDYDIQEWLK
jgi:hypothetical protein